MKETFMAQITSKMLTMPVHQKHKNKKCNKLLMLLHSLDLRWDYHALDKESGEWVSKIKEHFLREERENKLKLLKNIRLELEDKV